MYGLSRGLSLTYMYIYGLSLLCTVFDFVDFFHRCVMFLSRNYALPSPGTTLNYRISATQRERGGTEKMGFVSRFISWLHRGCQPGWSTGPLFLLTLRGARPLVKVSHGSLAPSPWPSHPCPCIRCLVCFFSTLLDAAVKSVVLC